MSALRAKADVLRALHRPGKPLILANVWDVASARIVEGAGFPAIATTSAGIAFALGYPDGQKISRSEMLAAVSRIARAVQVPVTADVEAGYGDRPEDAAQTAREVIAAGAVGMNFEDANDDPQHPLVEIPLQLERIRAIRDTAGELGVPLVLNARTDVYLAQVGPAETRYARTVQRLCAYRDAGADCVFAPGIGDAGTIARLVKDLSCPLNILAGPGSLSVAELAKLGVARISLGSAPMRAALGLLQRMSKELKESGTYHALEDAPAHGVVNAMMSRE